MVIITHQQIIILIIELLFIAKRIQKIQRETTIKFMNKNPQIRVDKLSIGAYYISNPFWIYKVNLAPGSTPPTIREAANPGVFHFRRSLYESKNRSFD